MIKTCAAPGCNELFPANRKQKTCSPVCKKALTKKRDEDRREGVFIEGSVRKNGYAALWKMQRAYLANGFAPLPEPLGDKTWDIGR